MWWQALNLLQKIFFCIAVPASVTLIVLIILMLIGAGDDVSGADLDGDGDVDTDVSDGLNFFTLRGLVAFFTVGGWVGYTLADGSAALSIILSLVCGAAALIGMAFILRALLKLQTSGNVQLSKAVGREAEVYLTIPIKDKGEGKINLTLDERFIEMNARQNGDEPIKTGSRVKITDVVGNVCIVEKI